jgi:Sec-independent protein translocase protein TatA
MLPGLNIVHLLVILVVALLVFGPDEAPKLARRGARAFQDLQRLREQLHDEVTGLLDLDGADEPARPPDLDAPPTTSTPSGSPAVRPTVTPTGRRTPSRHRPPATPERGSGPVR